MPSDGDSFLPRIQSVFYAVFDVRQGPKIVYQVPEGLIAVNPAGPASTSSGTVTTLPSTPSVEVEPPSPDNSSSSLVSPTNQRPNSRSLYSPQKRPSSSNHVLFHFDDISKYVIPPSALCGRLVVCSTKKYRVIGFPVELLGRYERNYFRYNLCFVFERGADLSCYEPVVRKVSRVLTSCEEESAFLSSSESSPAVHPILEQLYEDLNSYSETSIPIDKFNSIELKIFPFYPNPPAVKDWMVPLALINLTKRIEANWDLTMVKAPIQVCKFIDGTNHVSRIAHLADCDLELTRQAITHLLYYQVIMTIDIFQYSNMYTLRKSIQWLADEPHVREECGLYVTKPGRPIADWPKLLHLYSRLKPGKTVWEWMESYGIHDLGVDVRRFTSFGVIKGFLRRVHRWPTLLPNKGTKAPNSSPSSLGLRRGKSFSVSSTSLASAEPSAVPREQEHPQHIRGLPDIVPTAASVNAEPKINLTVDDRQRRPIEPPRKTSAAEKVLEQLRSRALPRLPSASSPRNPRTSEDAQEKPSSIGHRETRRHSLVSSFSALSIPLGQSNALSVLNPTRTSLGAPTTPIPSRPRASRSPSTPNINTSHNQSATGQGQLASPIPPYPLELLPLLDGEHHTDELATRFEVGWPVLEHWLISIGGGKGDGDFGKVAVVYR